MTILLTFSFLQCKENKTISNYSIDSKNGSIIKLSSNLEEISGISFSQGGKLFCHNDEIGIIYQLDLTSGKILKKFQLGKWGIEADFEDIAIVGEKFYLITSKGILYQFEEGNNLEKVNFEEIDLRFSSKFEIEGMCFDSITNSLLIASKDYAGKNKKGKRAIFTYSLKDRKVNKTPRFLISLKDLESKFGLKDFYPSAISQEPKTGNFFILSSKGKPTIVEIDSLGNLVSGKKLSKRDHPQPEGLAFNKNGDMIISDEAVDKSARITIYKNAEE